MKFLFFFVQGMMKVKHKLLIDGYFVYKKVQYIFFIFICLKQNYKLFVKQYDGRRTKALFYVVHSALAWRRYTHLSKIFISIR